MLYPFIVRVLLFIMFYICNFEDINPFLIVYYNLKRNEMNCCCSD